MPSVSAAILQRDSVSRRKWDAVAEITSGGSIDIFEAPRRWRNAAAKQQAFLRKEDAETRRISYLYDDGKESRYGQFNHQVLVPTPRPSDANSSSDDEGSENESASTSRSSSPESSQAEEPSLIKPRLRRNSTARRDREINAVQSESDESDSGSTCSSASETELPGLTDMSTKLADQLKGNRAVRQSMLNSVNIPEEATPAMGSDMPAAALRSGRVVKVSLKAVGLSIQPTALAACSTVLVAYKDAVSSRYGVALTAATSTRYLARSASRSTHRPTVRQRRWRLLFGPRSRSRSSTSSGSMCENRNSSACRRLLN
jgi:hypothetical protein